METVRNRKLLKNKAIREISQIHEHWNYEFEPIIADVGANIGYYSESFSEKFTSSEIHAYEPHPYNLQYLTKLNRGNVVVHEYGLFDKDIVLSIGVPSNRTNNNGLFSIHHTTNGVDVQLRNASNEKIRPHIVKIDVEGSELQVLSCSEFFVNTKLILIEIVIDDNFKTNDGVISSLTDLGFSYVKNTSKNNQLWSK